MKKKYIKQIKQSIEEALASVYSKQKELRERGREEEKEKENPRLEKTKRKRRYLRLFGDLREASLHKNVSGSLLSCL